MPLFNRTGLEQNTGLLKPRWNQEGSTLVNENVSTSVATNMHTVTAGKVLYVSTIYIYNNAATGANVIFTDVTLADVVFTTAFQNSELGGFKQLFFDPPLEFTDKVYVRIFQSITITITGWEEDIKN